MTTFRLSRCLAVSTVPPAPGSNPSFPAPNPRPSRAPAAEPTSGITPISASSHPAPLEVQCCLATHPCVTAAGASRVNVTTNISIISDLASSTPPLASGAGPAHHQVKETDIIPPSIVLGSQPMFNSMPVISRDTIPVAPLHFPMDSTVSQANSIHHILGSPPSTSSSDTVPLSIPATVSDQHATQSIGIGQSF